MRWLACAFALEICLLAHVGTAQEKPSEAPQVPAEPKPPLEQAPAKATEKAQDVSPDVLKWQNQAREVLSVVGDDKIPAVKRGTLYTELMALKPSAKEDTRLQLAYVLLAMNQKRYADALALTEQVISVSNHDAAARALQARLQLLTFKMPRVTVELESLIESLRDPAPTSSPEQLLHAARFLGLAVGYFSGPGRESIRPTALSELVVAARELPDDLRDAYEAAKLAMEEEFRVLTEEGEEALKALREGLEKEAAAMREQLEAQKAKLASDSEYAKLELEANFSRLNGQWQQAWNASQLLGQQGNDLMRRQAQLQISLGAVRPPAQDADGNVNLNDRQRYLNEVSFFENAINNLNFQISDVARDYNRVCAQGMIAERQMTSLQARARQLGLELAMQNQSFNQLDNAIRQKEQAAAKAEPKKKSKEQLRRERSFSTYDDFNIHKEKKLLLDSIELAK